MSADLSLVLHDTIDSFQARYGRSPCILDLGAGVSAPGFVVFSPPIEPLLPYLDHSIDVVVATATYESEAIHRVALGAIIWTNTGDITVEWVNYPELANDEQISVPDTTPTGKQVLFVAPILPEYDRESGARRSYHMIQLFQQMGYQVTYCADHLEGGERYIRRLHSMGVEVYRQEEELKYLLETRRFNVAVVSFWNLAAFVTPLIRALSPFTRIIVDSVDLHLLRESRAMFAAQGHLERSFAANVIGELNAYRAADVVLTVSQKEADFINALCADQNKALVLHDLEDMPRSPFSFDERKGILFVGNFRHKPNLEAIHFFLDEILPFLDSALLEQHPISFVGGNLPKESIDAIRRHPHMHVLGWVPHVAPYVERARAMVVPLRSGAGTKRKLLQALMIGTPSVVTSIGIEGLGLRDGQEVLMSDEPRAFAEAVTRLLTDQALWQVLADNGHSQIISSHSYAAVSLQFQRLLNHVEVSILSNSSRT